MKIVKAWWSSFDEISVVFSSDLPFVPRVEIIDGDETPSFSIRRAPRELFARFCSHFIDGGKITFVLDDRNFPNLCAAGNMDYYLCSDFNGWGNAIRDQKWKMEEVGPDKFTRELSVPLSDLKLAAKTGYFKFAGGDGKWLEPRADAPNVEFDRQGRANLRFRTDRTGKHIFVVKLDGVFALSEDIHLEFPELGLSCAVDEAERLVGIYSNVRQGAELVDGKTRFSIFAPRADAAYLAWWRPQENEKHIIFAESPDSATWVAKADLDLEGTLYSWHIDGKNDASANFDKYFPIVDPYANAMLSSKGPCIVKYDHSLPVASDAFVPPHWHDLVILETHLRDILAKAPAELTPKERLTFEGLTKWLSDKNCYIRKTGVNCVELQPVQEFTAEKAEDYEWGYMPVGWFAPASSYASNPSAASQNDDFAHLVEAFHKAGIAVILDVVYNHVGEPNPLLRVDKEYYFETASDDSLVNFSGCGNDFRARSPMAKKMILDSLKRLLIRYGVDGFRFDLAELLGMEVLKEIETELKKIRPSVILVAEPWSLRGHIARPLRETGWASWNDGFREFMLRYAKGQADTEGFKYFLGGSMGGTSVWPAQSVNYLESHDDMCLFDRITGAHEYPSTEDLRRYKTALALILLSHGIPMLAEGFDLLRTKGGKTNTYKDGAANALDYLRGSRFTGLAQWARDFVKFRLSDDARALRLKNPAGENFFKFFPSDGGGNAIGALYNADENMEAPQIFAAFNPSSSFAEIAVGDTLDGFRQIADIDRFDDGGLSDLKICPEHGVVRLAPISIALWIK